MLAPIVPPIVPNLTTVIAVVVDDVPVEIDLTDLFTADRTMYVNVTPIFKAFGKVPYEYLRSKRWKGIAAAFEEEYGIPAMRTEKGGKKFDTEDSRIETGGTWIHVWAVLDALRYVSPLFGLRADAVFRSIVQTETSRVEQREFLRLEHWEHSAALRDYWERNDRSGKPPYGRFFNAANRATTGFGAEGLRTQRKGDETRDCMTEEESSTLKVVLDTACTLLECDCDFDTILSTMHKTALKQFAKRARS